MFPLSTPLPCTSLMWPTHKAVIYTCLATAGQLGQARRPETRVGRLLLHSLDPAYIWTALRGNPVVLHYRFPSPLQKTISRLLSFLSDLEENHGGREGVDASWKQGSSREVGRDHSL